MSQVPDEAFARHINQIGIATLEKIEAAKALQAENARKGGARQSGRHHGGYAREHRKETPGATRRI